MKWYRNESNNFLSKCFYGAMFNINHNTISLTSKRVDQENRYTTTALYFNSVKSMYLRLKFSFNYHGTFHF